MVDFNPEFEIKQAVAKFLNLDNSFVFLFGSRATKNFRPNSDYDIGLYQNGKIPFSVIAQIKDELENLPIPVDIDIIDFSTTTSEFNRVALKEIQIWNKPKQASQLTLPL
ncbi:MAG: nucleotidyltransferase domain-containing protein [Candidatus Omnitrophica bacterium]|nr:nucleotidyltransferase domain-containing protein [Candidatus Omnitrophota bacterium]